jgi:DNA-binding NtrC family response regulator
MKPKVLIVEDNLATRTIWRESILATCQVIFASVTSEAYAAMRDEEPPDILVLDWHLNGSARAILNSWMEENSGPCCVISGRLEGEQITDFYSRGVIHVLQKPLPLEVFRAVIGHYIDLVELNKKCRKFDVEVAKMKKRQVLLMVLLFAVVGGKEFVSLLLRILT